MTFDTRRIVFAVDWCYTDAENEQKIGLDGMRKGIIGREQHESENDNWIITKSD